MNKLQHELLHVRFPDQKEFCELNIQQYKPVIKIVELRACLTAQQIRALAAKSAHLSPAPGACKAEAESPLLQIVL